MSKYKVSYKTYNNDRKLLDKKSFTTESEKEEGIQEYASFLVPLREAGNKSATYMQIYKIERIEQ